MRQSANSAQPRPSRPAAVCAGAAHRSEIARWRWHLVFWISLAALVCGPAFATEEPVEPPDGGVIDATGPDKVQGEEESLETIDPLETVGDAELLGTDEDDGLELQPPAGPPPLRSVWDRFSLTAEERPLGEVLAVLARHYGVNFIVGQGLREKIVSLYLREVGLQDAINGLLEAADLSAKRIPSSKLFIIKERGAVPASLVTRTFRPKYMRLDASGEPVAKAPSSGFSVASLNGTSASLPAQQSASRKASTDRLLGIIRSVLSEHGSVRVEAMSNSLVVTDTAEKIAEVEQLMARLDVAVVVLINVEIVGGDSEVIGHVGAILGGADSTLDLPLANPASSPAGGQLFTAASETFNIMLQALEREATDRFQSRRLKLLTLNNQATSTTVSTEPPVITNAALPLAPELSPPPAAGSAGFDLKVTPVVNGDGSISVDVQVFARPGTPGYDARSANTRVDASVRIKPGHTLLIGGFLPAPETEIPVPEVELEVPIEEQIDLAVLDPGAPAEAERELMILVTPEVVPPSWTQAN